MYSITHIYSMHNIYYMQYIHIYIVHIHTYTYIYSIYTHIYKYIHTSLPSEYPFLDAYTRMDLLK